MSSSQIVEKYYDLLKTLKFLRSNTTENITVIKEDENNPTAFPKKLRDPKSYNIILDYYHNCYIYL